MADVFSKEKRSEIMSRVRSKGNRATEEKLASLFRENGIKGWRRNYSLFGNPDFVFPKARIAVFVDGEFWHGHPILGQIPETNREFWVKKIERNKSRDNLVNQTLKGKSWIIVRIWQHELKDGQWHEKIIIAFNSVKKGGEIDMSTQLNKINEYIQYKLMIEGLDRVSAVQAAGWLNTADLLKDSRNRPGLPLRKLLRDGKIDGGRKNGRNWFIYQIDNGNVLAAESTLEKVTATAIAKGKSNNATLKNQVLPDVLKKGLDLVICGTAAGNRSASVKAYYAGKNNKFWDVLHEVDLTPVKLEPENYRQLLKYGVGLTDLAKFASGNDNQVVENEYDTEAFRKKIIKYKPKLLAFNGKNAAKIFLCNESLEYGFYERERIGKTKIYILPSTSGNAFRFWDISYWQELSNKVIEMQYNVTNK